MKRLIVILLLLAVTLGAKLPKSWKKCDYKSANFKMCIKDAVQDALSKANKAWPDIALPSCDPLKIPSMTIGEGKGTVAVVQHFKDIIFTGLSFAKLDTVDFDLTKKTFFLSGLGPSLVQSSHYDMNGRVLLLPIQGSGPSTLELVGCNVTFALKLEEFEKNGLKHLKATEGKLTANPSKVRFNFENLFNGDKQLGDNINNVLNDNWSEVYEDVRNGYETAYGQILTGIANSLFAKIPVSELFDNAT